MTDPDSATPRDGRWLRSEIVASWWEIFIVVALVIGLGTAKSTWAALHGSSNHYFEILLNDRQMVHYLAVEGGLLGTLLAYLHLRGWKRPDIRIQPGVVSTLQGIALAPSMLIANFVTVVTGTLIAFALQTKYSGLLPFIASMSQHLMPHGIKIGWLLMIATMILNAFYEEITCMGYAFSQFAAKRGPGFALTLTVLLRMSCHSYQGPIHMLGIGAVFLLAGIIYWKTRNLWPLIVAHALVDIGSMSLLKILRG